MILLDTNIVIEYLKRNTEITQEIDKIGFDNLCINDIVIMELYIGAFNKSDLRYIKNRINNIGILEITQEIINLAKEIIYLNAFKWSISNKS